MSVDVASEKRKKGGQTCCVPHCGNTSKSNPELSFHRFPNRTVDRERKQTWIARVKRAPTDEGPWQPTDQTRICSAHFVAGKKSENPNDAAYHPSIFPWKPENPLVLEREKRIKRRKERVNELLTQNKQNEHLQDGCVDAMDTMDVDVSNVELPFVTSKFISRLTQTDDATVDCSDDSPTILFCWQDSSTNDASTQTFIPVIKNRLKIKEKIVTVEVPAKSNTQSIAVGSDLAMKVCFQGFMSIRNDKSMRQMSGVSFEFFKVLLQFISPRVSGQCKYYKVLNAENRLLLFLMKMKLGLPFTALSDYFGISPQTTATIFYEVLNTLYESTKTWIFWPSREAIKKNMPASFQMYPNCRCIIDCTELPCETPPTVECRALMYSTYKSHYTVKFLIGMTPCGFISFISKGYGGRSSDCVIVNDSGFLSLLEPRDEVMADKGFPQIKVELMKQNCVLVMPPFATNPQFSREEVLDGYSVASVRIHVERCIQRVKQFRVLQFVPIKLIPWIDKIMYVACVLANNNKPLINSSKLNEM